MTKPECRENGQHGVVSLVCKRIFVTPNNRFLCSALAIVFCLLCCSAGLPAEIRLAYGTHQSFRYRHRDINVLGATTVAQPVRAATYRLNGAQRVTFYVKGSDEERDRISRNRLQSAGDFNIEIPVKSPHLAAGKNALTILLTDADGRPHETKMTFDWDPDPVPLPIDLSDLSDIRNLQQIAQVVDGAFELDAERNVIRTRAPVANDALLLLGSPHGSQEATYGIRFPKLGGNFLGLSDFFAGHEPAVPDIGIKPGWSSAGLATIRSDPDNCAQVWLAWGDLVERPEKWVVKTYPPKPFPVKLGGVYRVRHQVLFEDGIDRCRFRIWPEGEPEPETWLCEQNDSKVSSEKPKFRAGSFGLFQYGGEPAAWFDIRVRSMRPSQPVIHGKQANDQH